MTSSSSSSKQEDDEEEETSVESSMSSNMDGNDNTNDDDDDDDGGNNNNTSDEVERLKNECQAMLTLLQRLREEEDDLREKNVMLAREALLCGFQIENLEAPPPKRRMKSPTAARKEEK